MDEFLKQNYILLTHSVEIFAAITGLFCFKKYKSTTTKYFIWFLVYVVIIELLGSYPGYVKKYDFLNDIEAVLKDSYFEKNHWFFAIFWITGSALFYGLYFMEIIKNQLYKSIIKYAVISFILASIAYYVYNWELFFKGRGSFMDVFGVVVILVSVFLYFIEILKSDVILKFYQSINFYIAATLILWYLIVTPLSFYNKYFTSADWNFVILKYQIHLFANVFMYLTFTFALIYCRPTHD